MAVGGRRCRDGIRCGSPTGWIDRALSLFVAPDRIPFCVDVAWSIVVTFVEAPEGGDWGVEVACKAYFVCP